ncbi:MAG: InlB B-repeat-containing protein [Candidatus Micrarchaeia archaeon]
MGKIIKLNHKSNKKKVKEQSAIEYVMSYSWAVIILLAVVIIYFFANSNQTTYTPTSCYISPQLPCYQLIIGSNSIETTAKLVFTNDLNKPIYFYSQPFSIKFTPSSNYYSGTCVPTTANEGSNVTCTVVASGYSILQGSEAEPTFYLSYAECVSQNCNINQRQLITLTTSGSGTSYIYNLSGNFIVPQPVFTNYFYLVTNSFPSIGGSTSPGYGVYAQGTNVIISESPSSGYTFSDWTCSGTGCYSGTSPSEKITINSNTIETASFQQIPIYTLTTNAVPSGSGSVSPTSGSYEQGSQVTILASANPGYTFNGWTCSGTGCYSGTSPSNTITITSNTVETANYKFNTGYFGYVPPFNGESNQTYLYSSPYAYYSHAPQQITLWSDLFHNLVLNNLNTPSSTSTILNLIGTVNNGYLYELALGEPADTYYPEITIINTSKNSVQKTIFIQNATVANEITTSQDTLFANVNSTGSLYILSSKSAGSLSQVSLIVANTSLLNDAMQSSNLFYNITKITSINLSNTTYDGNIVFPEEFTNYPISSFLMLGNYAYIANQSTLYILNTSKSNVVANSMIIYPKNKVETGALDSGIINMQTSGNYVYFDISNTTVSSSTNYNTVISVLNTTSLKVTNITIVNSPNNYTVGAVISNHFKKLYILLSNQTLYTIDLSSNGLGTVSRIQDFATTTPFPSTTSTLESSLGSEYNMLLSANGTELYVGTTYSNGYNGYAIYNLVTGTEVGFMGTLNAVRVVAPQNNYNIYTTASQNQAIEDYATLGGIVGVYSSAYNINKENITIPSNFIATALLFDGNILRIGGYNYSDNSLTQDEGLLTTANVMTDTMNSNVISPEAEISYFANTGYPMTPTQTIMHMPSIMDFSEPTGQFFSIPALLGGTSNLFLIQQASQVFPTNEVLDGLAAVSSNTQASDCVSSSECISSGSYLTAYSNIDAYSSYATPSGVACVAEANYGIASTATVNLYGMIENANNLLVMSYQENKPSTQDFSSIYTAPTPGGMGANAASAYFNYWLNDTIASQYAIADSQTITQIAAGTGDAGGFGCSNPPNPNEFITDTYWTMTQSALESQALSNSIVMLPPAILANNTNNVYMFNIAASNGGLAVYNIATSTYSEIPLPKFSSTAYVYPNDQIPSLAETTNGTFVFAGYQPFSGYCAIAVINTQLEKVVKVNYGLPVGSCEGDTIVTPDGKYLYSGIAEGLNSEYVFSVHDLITYNSSEINYTGSLYNYSIANIGTMTMPITYGIYAPQMNYYQGIAISTDTQPIP